MDFTSDKQLKARVEDACRLCERRGMARFVGFLDEHESALARSFVQAVNGSCTVLFYGGHEDAERMMLGVFPDASQALEAYFPMTAVAFRYRTEAALTHRDVLGSLLGGGIAREKIGDIVCGEGLAVAFLHDDIVPYISETIDRIGREGVTIECPFSGELPVFRRFRPISGTVASPRLDAIVKVLLGVSREQAARLIETACVRVNHTDVLSVSRTMTAGDVVSIKGHGRYVIDDVSALSKKGRVILSARQYV